MVRRKQVVTAVAGSVLALALGTSTALAHFCTPANKLPGAGSVGVYNVVTESFTPGKKYQNLREGEPINGGFITITDGESFAYDVFLHNTLPDGAFAAGPGGDDQCDGRGVDNALVCLGLI